MAETIYLRRPPDWEEHEKPALPGSPAMPYHPPWERACYAVVAILVALTGGLGNALFAANLPTIQGQMGMTPTESAWLTGAFVTFHVTANLLVYKFRQQYGMRLFTELSLGAYALLCLLHLVIGSADSLLWLRGASGLAAAACTSLGTLYMLQSLPRKYVLKTLVFGMGLSQLATPLAWIVSPSLLANGQWNNLYLFEAGLALLSFGCVVLLKLPTGVQIKAFEPRDFVSMGLLIPGVGLLVAVLVLGTTRWWFNAPELAWMLIGAIALLFTGLYLEHHRSNPLLHTRWFTQPDTLRFVLGAVVLRFLTTEQSYGMVGMLRTLGMTTDQMQPLFALIFAGTLLGMVISAVTFSVPSVGRQLLAAIVLLGVATWLDFSHTSQDRPANFFLSQFVLSMGAGIFMGPLMLIGIAQGLKNGPGHMLTAILTISVTQTLGGLAGSALLGTYQTYRQQAHSVALTQQIDASHPIVAQRLQQYQAALSSQITDSAQRAAQSQAQMAQIVRREAHIAAYDDVFHLVSLVSLGYLCLSVVLAAHTKRVARQAAARNAAAGGAASAGTDASPTPKPSPGAPPR